MFSCFPIDRFKPHMYLGIEKNYVCINLNSISIRLCKLMYCFLLGLSGKAKSFQAVFGMIFQVQEAHNIINFESLRFSVLILFCWALALITVVLLNLNILQILLNILVCKNSYYNFLYFLQI